MTGRDSTRDASDTVRDRAGLRSRAVRTVGLAVFLGSVLVGTLAVILVQAAVTRSLDDTLTTRAADVRAQLAERDPAGRDPVQLPPLDPHDPVVVQVVDDRGRLLAATPGVSQVTRICPTGAPAAGRAVTRTLAQPGLNGTFRVLVVSTGGRGGSTLSVCAARSDERAELTRNLVVAVLAAAAPAVTALACLLVRQYVGAALAVVGGLAREAGRLQTLDQGRLNVPATGDEVQDLARTFNELLDRVHAQSKAVRQFVADAGHELRTPLASLRVCLDLAEDAAPGEARAAVRDGLMDVERLTVLVGDLLELARVDLGEPPSPTSVCLPDAVLEEISSVRRAHPGLVVEVHGGPLAVRTDARAARTVLANLLSNGARHAASRVIVRVRQDGARAVVDVVDDGPGVPPEDLHRIFDRFVRLDDARTRDTGGIGLGLPIAAALAERNGGRVTALPAPGGRFMLELPLAPERHRLESVS